MTFSVVSAQEVYANPDAPMAAEVLDTKMHTGDPDEMKYVIPGKPLDRYDAAYGIEVKRAKIDTDIISLHRLAD